MSVDLWDDIESRNEHIAELEAEVERLRREIEQLLAVLRGIRAVADGPLEKASS